MLTKRSLDRALRSIEKNLEAQICKNEEDLRIVRGMIRINEEREDAVKKASSFADEVSDVVHTILEQESPLHRSEILKRVESYGLHVGGSKPANNLGTYLSRDTRFVNVGKGMWALEEAKPTANPESNGHEEVDLAAIGLVS